MQFLFGSGVFWGTPLQDASGAAIAVPTPVQLGVMQDISIDISFDTKELYGQSQFPVAVGRGKGKMAGKCKVAQINGRALDSLLFGQGLSAGVTSDVYDVIGAVIPSSPYIVVPTIPLAGTWAADLGIRDSNGIPMTRVAAAPTTGQYSLTGAATGGTASFATNVMTCTVAPTLGTFQIGQAITSAGVAVGTFISSLGTGVGGTGTYNLSTSPGTITAQAVTAGVGYLFAAADVAKTVFMSYQYTAVSTSAQKGTVKNVLMGQAPTFKGDLYVPYGGKSLILTIPQCIASKWTLATKQDDFVVPEFAFSGFADAAGNALYWAVSES